MNLIPTLDAVKAAPSWLRPIDIAPLIARSPRLLLVDNQELVRVGVKTLHAHSQGIQLCWLEAESLEDAIATYAREGDIDAVLLDLNLPDCKGLRGLQLFRLAHPKARIAAFCGSQDEFVVRQARALGAVSFICKGLSTIAIRNALEALLWPNVAAQSQSQLSTVSNNLFPRSPSLSTGNCPAELKARHLEILELLLSGCTNHEIGRATRLSLGTIKNYVSSLLVALNVESRAHLISLFA